MLKCPNRNESAYVGDSALRIDGLLTMPRMPQAPITTNQTTITGPNSRPTTAVPSRCSRKRPMMITAVIGSTMAPTDGAATCAPSIAESTEIAGVIMLSPKNSDAPNTPSTASASATRRLLGAPRRISVISAMIPPSPSLSARITTATTAQKISETTPYTCSVVTWTRCGSDGLKTVCTV